MKHPKMIREHSIESSSDRSFTVTGKVTINIIGAETILYTHNKTGARVVHIANEDKERALRISFGTLASDNKGIPHAFEHICVSGSQKYASSKLFLSACSQTYNTYMNASTYDTMTSYEYSTMSETQLLLITDYYMDSVFNPLLYSDELTFRRESWRYELTDADAPLNINGIVYNEMKGAFTLERAASHNTLNALYPGSIAANDSGGIPKDILTMTYEDCVNFHKTYYHPSNALIFLYGDLDVGPFLELIDSYCNQFDRKSVRAETGANEAKIPEPLTAVLEYPVEISSEAEDNSVIYYAFDIGKLSPQDYAAFDILATILGNDSSPVIRKLREVMPDAGADVSFDPTVAGCYLAVSVMGVNERDKDTLKAAVDEAIAEIIEEGFETEHLEAAIISEEFYVLSIPERAGLGLGLTSKMAWLDSLGLGYDNWNEYLDAINIAKAKYASSYFEALVEKYIANNPHNVLVATVPAPGLKEKLDEQFRAELDAIKAGMSDEELAQIIDMNKALTDMSEAAVPAELFNRLTGVTVETLPVEVKAYDIRETTLNGVKAYVAKAGVGNLNITCVDYNSAAVTLEELHYLNLYADLLGEVPTKNLDLTTLQARMTRYLHRFGAEAGSREFYDYSCKPVFSVQWYSIRGDYVEAAALVQEMLMNTDLTDLNTISGVIGRLKVFTRKSINDRPHDLMYARAKASRFARFAYNEYMHGVAYHQFLSKAQEFLGNDPAGFTAKLMAVRDKLRFKNDAVIMFVGSAEGIEVFEKNASVLLGHLTDEAAPAPDLSSIPRPNSMEGVVIDALVQYNVAFVTHDETGLKYDGKLLPVAAVLSDAYLTPTVQYTIGAYGCWAVAGRHGFAFISYRDPSVTETFATYKGVAGFAADHGLTQEDVDRYIIRSFSQQAAPEGELIGALNAILYKYQGYPDNHKLNVLKEIKSFTVSDLTAISNHLALAMDKGVRSTAGGQSVILENAELYESIVYPFGVQA